MREEEEGGKRRGEGGEVKEEVKEEVREEV